MTPLAVHVPGAVPRSSALAAGRRSRCWWKGVRGFVILPIASQLGFGLARLWAAGDADGIGVSNTSYPSIQGPTMKTR